MQQILITGVAIDRPEPRIGVEVNRQQVRARLTSSFEPLKGLIILAQADVNEREIVRRDATVLCQLVEVLENLERFLTLS